MMRLRQKNAIFCECVVFVFVYVCVRVENCEKLFSFYKMNVCLDVYKSINAYTALTYMC